MHSFIYIATPLISCCSLKNCEANYLGKATDGIRTNAHVMKLPASSTCTSRSPIHSSQLINAPVTRFINSLRKLDHFEKKWLSMYFHWHELRGNYSRIPEHPGAGDEWEIPSTADVRLTWRRTQLSPIASWKAGLAPAYWENPIKLVDCQWGTERGWCVAVREVSELIEKQEKPPSQHN
jgi:hypothetical protein